MDAVMAQKTPCVEPVRKRQYYCVFICSHAYGCYSRHFTAECIPKTLYHPCPHITYRKTTCVCVCVYDIVLLILLSLCASAFLLVWTDPTHRIYMSCFCEREWWSTYGKGPLWKFIFIGFAVHALHVDTIFYPRRDNRKLMAATSLLS